MVYFAVVLFLCTAAAAFGAASGKAAIDGRDAGLKTNLKIGAAGLVVAALSHAAVLAGRRGAFPPDHAFNGIVGNAVVVGGLIVGAGLVTGALVARLTVLRSW